MSIFAERLKTAMTKIPMTSAQLAKATGIGRSSISQWLSSKYIAKHDKVVILARALHVEPDWLLGANTTEVAATANTVDPELIEIWGQLDATGHKKLVKKARRLIEKAAMPAGKKKSKKKKKAKA